MTAESCINFGLPTEETDKLSPKVAISFTSQQQQIRIPFPIHLYQYLVLPVFLNLIILIAV